MQNFDIAIIGGGAAGLFSAAFASDLGANVVVLEKMERCGRKIGITGKGRCNLTNTKPWDEFSQHIHSKSNFLKRAFYTTDNLAVMKYFENVGLQLVVERGDRVFPKSMCAHDVSDILIKHIKDNGAAIITSFNVSSIKYVDNMFVISSCKNADIIYAKKVIVATGGLSYPSTGSTGDGYVFAKEFGHEITSCFPSLTALIPDKYNLFFGSISSFFREEKSLLLKNVEVSLFINGNNVATEFGDLDFTSGGIEGPIGFKVSRKAVFALINGQKVELLLDLKPAVPLQQLYSRILRDLPLCSNNIDVLLRKLMPIALVKQFKNYLLSNNIGIVAGNNEITAGNIANALKSWKFKIVSNVGYERAVVTAGGVSLSAISQKTMESKIVPGLYFAGEIIDIDGDTGGYNLQVAFSTGALAAITATKSLI